MNRVLLNEKSLGVLPSTLQVASMNSIAKTALAFFEACESGKGWQGCRDYCHSDAAFDVQALSQEDLRTVRAYSESVPHLLDIIPDACYDVVSVATDEALQAVFLFTRFRGSHIGIDVPVAATGNVVISDCVYIMWMKGGKVSRVTKVWNDAHAAIQLGWS